MKPGKAMLVTGVSLLLIAVSLVALIFICDLSVLLGLSLAAIAVLHVFFLSAAYAVFMAGSWLLLCWCAWHKRRR